MKITKGSQVYTLAWGMVTITSEHVDGNFTVYSHVGGQMHHLGGEHKDKVRLGNEVLLSAVSHVYGSKSEEYSTVYSMVSAAKAMRDMAERQSDKTIGDWYLEPERRLHLELCKWSSKMQAKMGYTPSLRLQENQPYTVQILTKDGHIFAEEIQHLYELSDKNGGTMYVMRAHNGVYFDDEDLAAIVRNRVAHGHLQNGLIVKYNVDANGVVTNGGGEIMHAFRKSVPIEM